MTINQNMTGKDWLRLITLAMIWGFSFYFIAIAVTALPPLTIVTLRIGIAAIALWLFIGLKKYPFPPLKYWKLFFIIGVFNNVIPFTFIVWGQTHISSGLASMLNATVPLFTILVAGFFLADERISLRKITGVIIGIFGVITLIGPSILLEGLNSNVLGQFAVLLAALSYAFGTIIGRSFKRLGIKPIVGATGQVTASTLMMLPLAFYFDAPQNLTFPPNEVVLAILGLSLISTAFAYHFYFRILESSGATNISLVTFLIPVFAVLLGASLLGETFIKEHFIGMLLIGIGLAVIDGRLSKVVKSKIIKSN